MAICARCRPLSGAWRSALSTAAASLHHGSTPAAQAPRPPRFYIPTPLEGAAPGAALRLPPDEARHATKTLRLREGDAVELCDGRGFVVAAEISGIDKNGALLHTAHAPLQVPLTGWQWEVSCACGSLKGGRSDWLVEKCAELGAAAFAPLLTQRSPTIGSGGGDDERPAARGGGKRAGRRREGGSDDEAEAAGSGREGRWARVATAAMKQCLRPHALALRPPCSVEQLCARIAAADAALVGVAGAPPLHQIVAEISQQQQQQQQQGQQKGQGQGQRRAGMLCIGPEGDWTPEELRQLVAAGARPVGLGDLRLRAETAAVALLAYVRLHLP